MKIVRCVTETLFVPRLPFKCRNHSYPRPNTMMNNLVCGAQRPELWAKDRLICQLFFFFFLLLFKLLHIQIKLSSHCLNEEPAVKHSGGSDLLGVTEHETIVEEPRTLRLRGTTDNRLLHSWRSKSKVPNYRCRILDFHQYSLFSNSFWWMAWQSTRQCKSLI